MSEDNQFKLIEVRNILNGKLFVYEKKIVSQLNGKKLITKQIKTEFKNDTKKSNTTRSI